METTQSSPTSSSSSQSFSLPFSFIQPHSVFNISNIKNHIYDHIDETSQCPSPTISIDNDDSSSTQINPAYTLWIQIDHLIVFWLHATISPEILKHVFQPGKQFSARRTWLEIQKLLHDHVNAKYMQLRLAFNQASKGTQSMAEFLQFIKSTVDSLHSIGRLVDDDDVILQILSGLSPEYSDVVPIMIARKPLPSFLELRKTIREEDASLILGGILRTINNHDPLAIINVVLIMGIINLVLKTLFTNILHCYHICDHIDETSKCPSTTISIDNDDSSSTQINPAYTLWIQIDHLIVSWLHATISPEILKHVFQPGKQFSAHRTWLEIQKLLHDHVNAKYMQLRLAFNQASKGTQSMAEFLQFIKSTVDSLHSIGRLVDDDDVILQILSGLLPEYSDACNDSEETIAQFS
ncbi:unnamed protein product [Fraxinus pennsylvanica]|uniref:Uncharacterized protein n=1 Tax=Fraxinus pennsylvanica TaxID=56036 RepID=A0AAD1ZLJ0_9LAMI|nr:unnamed protein product [Fraxinus pennsylvanica]